MVMVGGRGVVLLDDGRHIEGESAEVIDPAADPLAVTAAAAARAAVGVIPGHRAAGQADGRPASNVDASTEAIAARAPVAAQGQVLVQRAAGVAGVSGQYRETAAPAITAVATHPTGAAKGLVVVESAAAEGQGRSLREETAEDATADVDGATNAGVAA